MPRSGKRFCLVRRFIAPLGLSRTPRQNEEDPGQRKESPALHTASSSIASYGALASQTATHRTGIPISALDTNEQKTHAVLAGKEILKTVKVQDGCVTEEFNLRTSILAYASTHGSSSQPDAAARRREYLSCRDVRWSSKQFSHVIATAAQNGRIALYDVNVAGARTELAWIHDHTGQVNKLDFDVFVGYMMLSASTDKTVRMTDIRDTRAAKCTQKFVVRSGVRHVAWSPVEGNDFEFAVCADGGLVQHWDARNPRGPTLSIHAHERGCYSLDWHPGGRHVVSGGTDKYVRVWDLKGERRQKPVFSFRAPQAIRNVKWRPPSWSSDSSDSGTWQTTQVATTYQLDDPRLHVWDLRRPMIPFREIDTFNRPASDFLWASKDVIWACGEEGLFTQNDVNFAPQVHQICPPSSLQSLPSGDCILFSEERPHRHLSKGEDSSAAFLSLAPDGPSQGDEAHQPTDLDPEDRESVHNESLLSTSFKRKVRSVPPRSASSAANLSHSASPQTPNPLNSVLQLNKATRPGSGTFGNDQAGFVGSIIGAAPEPDVVEFLAQYYSAPPSEIARKKNPDRILEGLTARFLNNADVCSEASMHRMAQSWRILESVIVPELRGWADSNRAARRREDLKTKERGEKERQKTKEKADSIRSFSKPPARHAVASSDVKPQKLVSHLLSAVTDSERAIAEPGSTSNMTTPLARPLKEPPSALKIEHSRSEHADSPDGIESLQPLPPSVLASHATAAAAARALADSMGLSMPLPVHDEVEREVSSSSQEEDVDLIAAERILERSPMINPQVHEEKRAALLDYRIQARPIFSLDSRSSQPRYDQDSRHDSSESFAMFSTSTSSSQRPQLLGQSFGSERAGDKSGGSQDDQDQSAHVDNIGSFSSGGNHSLSKEGGVKVHDFSDSPSDPGLSVQTDPGSGLHEPEAKKAEPAQKLEAFSPEQVDKYRTNSIIQPSTISSSVDELGYQPGHQPTQRKIHITNPALSISSLADLTASQAARSMTELRDQDGMDADGYVVTDFWPIDLSRYETKLPFALSALPLACQMIAYDASSGIAAGQFAALLLLYLAPYFWHPDYRRELSAALPLPQPQDTADRLMRPDLAQRVLEGILMDHLEYLQRARLYDAVAALRRSCAELGFERAQSQRAAKPQESMQKVQPGVPYLQRGRSTKRSSVCGQAPTTVDDLSLLWAQLPCHLHATVALLQIQPRALPNIRRFHRVKKDSRQTRPPRRSPRLKTRRQQLTGAEDSDRLLLLLHSAAAARKPAAATGPGSGGAFQSKRARSRTRPQGRRTAENKGVAKKSKARKIQPIIIPEPKTEPEEQVPTPVTLQKQQTADDEDECGHSGVQLKRTTSTTASGFAILAYKNGILNPRLSKPPSNIEDIHKRRVEPRRSASPTESECNHYVKKVEGARNEMTLLVETSGKLLKDYNEDGYNRVFNQAFTGFPKDIGLNNNLSAPQPDYIEGLEMQEYRPLPIDDHLKGAVLYKDDPSSLTLPLLAGEWKGRGKDMEEARLQSAYDGAALVYARNQALSYLGKSDPPGHAEVTTFTTDGTNLNLFAHYATLSTDGTAEYHQYPIKSTNLTDSHQAFRDGRRGLRNAQDHARKQSYCMRDHLRERWKRRRGGSGAAVAHQTAGRKTSSTRRR
ncbi:hypothetical protein DV738_g2010, partial [Chaetothyriales sp. CBS 135597]